MDMQSADAEKFCISELPLASALKIAARWDMLLSDGASIEPWIRAGLFTETLISGAILFSYVRVGLG